MLLGGDGVVILALADPLDHPVIECQVIVARAFGGLVVLAGDVFDKAGNLGFLLAGTDRDQRRGDQQQPQREQRQPCRQAAPADKTVLRQGRCLIHQASPDCPDACASARNCVQAIGPGYAR